MAHVYDERYLLRSLQSMSLSVVFVVSIQFLLLCVHLEAVFECLTVADGEREIEELLLSPALEVDVDTFDAVVALPFEQHVETPAEGRRLE